MGKLGFYYNMNTCVSCGACQIACKKANHLQPGEFFRRCGQYQYGPYSGACNHCDEAACVKVCPTGAMYKADDGTTQHDDGKCIACGACMWNCPYGAISISKKNGVAQKCNSCYEKRLKGNGPACVKACPTNSLKFGVLEEITNSLETISDIPSIANSSITLPNLKIKPSANLIKIALKKVEE